MKKHSFSLFIFYLLSAFLLSCFPALSRGQVPPNDFPEVNFDGKNISIKYDSELIFEGSFIAGADDLNYRYVPNKQGGKIDLALVFNGTGMRLEGAVYGSGQSFACESERPRKGIPIVRHTYGPVKNSRNQAVYDRAKDWLLSVDLNPKVEIRPGNPEKGKVFEFSATGYEIVLRFRPRFYQKHKGLEYFEPWTYGMWEKPIVGWCSWFAYWNRVTEKDMMHTADVLSEKLLDYGLEYIQMDDGYQRANGHPDYWLTPNEKFPSGLGALAKYISGKGFEPGIWTAVSFHQPELVPEYRDYFIKDKNGDVPEEPWVGFPVDGSNEKALDELVRPLYSGLKEMGWTYVKLDALRHLRYEGYNRHKEYFEGTRHRAQGTSRVKEESLKDEGWTAEKAFRNYVMTVKEELGDDILLMGCWGIRPELTGMIHACRIGGDGFSYAGLAQYNSFNNVVWQNDPDHIELSPEEAWRSTTVTSLTGSMYMLTDKPEVYETAYLDAARRTIPVLFTLPGQVYEVDPSRIENLEDADIEVSGSNHRPFDANLTATVDLYQLDVAKPEVGEWTLLGRTGDSKGIQGNSGDSGSVGIGFGELGLDPEKEYMVFEFWSKRYTGSFVGELPFGDIDPKYKCEVFCIRERKDVPQLLATNRHISCGALEIQRLKAQGTGLKAEGTGLKEGSGNEVGSYKLAGESEVVGGEEPYILYLTEPDGYQMSDVNLSQGKVMNSRKEGMVRVITIGGLEKGILDWELRY